MRHYYWQVFNPLSILSPFYFLLPFVPSHFYIFPVIEILWVHGHGLVMVMQSKEKPILALVEVRITRYNS